MRKWMRDRLKRRNKPAKPGQQSETQQEAPLQPTFLDREASVPSDEIHPLVTPPPIASVREPEYEAQPEADPTEVDNSPDSSEADKPMRRDRSRRRGRGGRGRNRQRGEQRTAGTNPPVLSINPGQATGEASELEPIAQAETPATEAAAVPPPKKGKTRGAVVLAIGLPGSGKSSWFRRHNIIPLSSDLVRGLLFDDPTEQRYQDLVFSSLRSLLRARLIAGRPMNYIDATNLSPKERHSWIKMARDFGYEAHAVFFDVPTDVCMERNRKRSRNVPDEIMVRMGNKLRPPKFEEGFAKVTIVRLKQAEKREIPIDPLADPEE